MLPFNEVNLLFLLFFLCTKTYGTTHGTFQHPSAFLSILCLLLTGLKNLLFWSRVAPNSCITLFPECCKIIWRRLCVKFGGFLKSSP